MEEFNDVDQQANALSLIDLDYQFSGSRIQFYLLFGVFVLYQ